MLVFLLFPFIYSTFSLSTIPFLPHSCIVVVLISSFSSHFVQCPVYPDPLIPPHPYSFLPFTLPLSPFLPCYTCLTCLSFIPFPLYIVYLSPGPYSPSFGSFPLPICFRQSPVFCVGASLDSSHCCPQRPAPAHGYSFHSFSSFPVQYSIYFSPFIHSLIIIVFPLHPPLIT